ncbi:MAG: hypothetical protein IKB68_06515 [Rikenellaceae bacterium]|nr:hypothetical protein [Rikenellaceae bacterium]
MDKTIVIVKKGNPFILDESPFSLNLYNSLRTLAQSQNFDRVIVGVKSVEITMGVKAFKKAYPKDANIKWLFEYLDTFWIEWERKNQYNRVMQPVADFLKLARQQMKRGGTFDFTDDTETCVEIKCGTFVARMWDLKYIRDCERLVWRDIVELIKESRETQRLKKLCEANNIKV